MSSVLSPLPNERCVKGNVIADYIKMIRANPELPWAEHLLPEDLVVVQQMVVPLSWYPIQQFQRLGLAVFKLVTKENNALVRAYGASVADRMNAENPGMVAKGRPQVTLSRYIEIQKRLYSFKAQETVEIGPGRLLFLIHSNPEEVGIPVYIEQISGTVERLIALSGGRNIQLKLLEAVWKGAAHNRIEVQWE